MFLYRAFLVVSLSFYGQYRNPVLASAANVIRSSKGDLFRNWKTPLTRARTSKFLKKSCRDSQASCEGSTCFFCRCKARDQRPTYVDSLQMCVGNSALPQKINKSACKWRLVAQEKEGNKTCLKETVPVIGLNAHGWHPLNLCTFNKDYAIGLENITSCSVSRGAQYFNSGKWYSSGATFTMGKTRDNLFVKWNRYTGAHAIGYIFNINVRCSFRDGRQVTACLILKSTNATSVLYSTATPSPITIARRTTSSSTTTSILTTAAKIKAAKDRIPQQQKTISPTSVFRTDRETTAISDNEFTDEKAKNKNSPVTSSEGLPTSGSGYAGVTLTLTTLIELTTDSSVPPVLGQNGATESLYLMVAIGCSLFVFCASIMCVLIILVRRRKRKLQNKHTQGNPLYDEGVAIPLVTTNASNGSETRVIYQPLVQNSRCKHSNKPVIYQALMKKGRSLDTLNDYKNVPKALNTAQYQSLDRKKGCQGAANKVYQSLTPPRDMNTGELIGNEEPSDVVYYSTPDDVYKDAILPVNKKRLKGYYEPGCIVLGQQTDKPLKTEPPQYHVLQQDPHKNFTSQQTHDPATCRTKDFKIPEYQELESHPLYHVVERG